MKKCPKCHEECEDRKRLCPNCGFVFQMNDIEIKEEEKIEDAKFEEEKKSFHFERIFYSILGIISFIIDIPIIITLITNIMILTFIDIMTKENHIFNYSIFIFVIIKIICLILINIDRYEVNFRRVTGIIMLLIIIVELYLFLTLSYSFY